MKKITPLILILLAFNFSYGQIVTFDFDGNVGDDFSVNSNFNDTNLSASIITRGTGLSANNSFNRFNAQSWALVSINNAVTGNDYMEFTITPNIGFQFDVTTININFQRSSTGVSGLALRSSFDSYVANIDSEKVVLDNTSFQTFSFNVSQTNNSTAMTYRFYGWAEEDGGSGGFEGFGNDITVNGLVSAIPGCSGITTTWDGSGWDFGLPDFTKPAIINNSYITNGSNPSFSACSLIVNGTLTINDGYFVEIENDVVVDGGTIDVQPSGALIQRGLAASAGTFSFINGGNATLTKSTKSFNNDGDFHYTYWSSPVVAADIVTVFANPAGNRRYYYDASAFLDEHTIGTTNGIPDDIDDDNNDWRSASGTMLQGMGYAVTAVDGPPLPGTYSDIATFSGEYNTGNFDVTIYRNDTTTGDNNWNLIGNPYPSAINAEEFLLENYYNLTLNPTGVLGGVIYFWTHNTTASSANPGNQAYNYSQSDYATMNLVGGVLGASPAPSGSPIPNGYIPSGQGFFATFADNPAPTTGGAFPVFTNTVNFNNDMRMADGSSNSQFFKNANSKNKSATTDNKLWVNLTSNNGVFNQTLIAYSNSASNNYDGEAFDAPKNLSSDAASILYTIINDSNKKFAIQGKDINSINEDEVINLGFKTTINVATLYKLSIAQLQGDFLTSNTIYLKDNLLNTLNDLTASDYTFTSEVGEFNNRFEIVFSAIALSTEVVTLDSKSLKIVHLNNDNVQFSTSSNLSIKSVKIFDLLGRQLYNLKGNSNSSSETYTLSNLNNAVYIAKVKLSNGALITKKFIEK